MFLVVPKDTEIVGRCEGKEVIELNSKIILIDATSEGEALLKLAEQLPDVFAKQDFNLELAEWVC